MIPFSRLWKGRPAVVESAPGGSATFPLPTQGIGSIKAGSEIGRCLLLRLLGEGAYGRVFHAHHKTLNISVAVKILQPGMFHDPRVHDQLKHEAQLLARLNHPNVVRVWDFEDSPSCPYIVLEFIEGPSLAELIEQSGRLAPDRVIQLMRQTARGLNAAWKLGIVHRDLKPANILLTRGGDAKLSDLGLAFVMGAGAPQPPGAGTPLYAAPEQCFAPEKVDQRSDLYSLGATFYHALTGSPPFDGTSMNEVMHQHANEAPVPPHQRAPGIPVGLSAIVLRLLGKEPEYRYPSYEDFLAALDGQGDCSTGQYRRARQTCVVPKASIEAVLRTEPFLKEEPAGPAAPGPEVGEARRVSKETKVVPCVSNLSTLPSFADPPRSPSQAADKSGESRPASGSETRSVATIATPAPPEPGVDATPPPAKPTPAEQSRAAGRLSEGIAAVEAGRTAEAVGLLREVARLDSGNKTAWLWLARAVGPGAESLGIYQHLLQQHPDDVSVRQGLLGARLAAAAADARSGNRPAARAALRQLIREYPDLEDARVGLARIAESQEEADDLWQTVLRMNPSRAEARVALARRNRR
jgi:serine/threonine protein kinase